MDLPSVASIEQQQAYWAGATVIHSIAFLALLVLVREYFLNAALRTRGMFCFLGQVAGDCLLFLAYSFYHAGNVARGSVASHDWCYFVSPATTVAVMTASLSVMSIAFSAYVSVATAIKGAANWFQNKFLVFWWCLAVLQGVWWAGLLEADGNLGTYRALYCFARTYNRMSSGGVVLTLVPATVAVSSHYYFLLYRLLKEHQKRMVGAAPSAFGGTDADAAVLSPTAPTRATVTVVVSPNGNTTNSPNTGNLLTVPNSPHQHQKQQQQHFHHRRQAVDLARMVARRGGILVASYLFHYSLLSSAAVLQFCGVTTPVILDLLAGWLVKLKPIVTAVSILSFAPVRAERHKRGGWFGRHKATAAVAPVPAASRHYTAESRHPAEGSVPARAADFLHAEDI